MVEDDMFVSPLYFKYLRRVIETYYYNPSNYDPTVYGISLQRPRFVPGKHGSQLRVDDATHLFLYQLVGTWGQLLFPKPWKEFRLWYDVLKSKNIKPVLEGMVTTGWYHRSKERIWTPWFIKFAYSKGYFNLYTHFSNEQALSVSYRDKGVNTKKEAGPDSTLIGNENVSGLNSWEMKPLDQLKRYDFCFHEVKQGRLIENAQGVKTIVPSFEENGTVILVDAVGFREEVIRNWLCQFSKLSIRNFVILIQDRELEKSLLRQGHAVMHLAPELLEKEIHRTLKHPTLKDKIVYIERALTVIQAVTMITHSGYNIWLTDVGTLWLANPFPLVHIDNADILGFTWGTGVSSELLYIKGSKRMMSFWGNLYRNVLHQADFVANSISSNYKQNYLGVMIGNNMSKGTLSFKPLSTTLKVDLSVAYSNESDGPPKLAAALLVGIPSNDSYASALKSFGLWKLDEELVCTGVYC
ncbi:hypothetical protein GOP47_0020628 [Adiantum capillus-veneris]|uniref:Nucleotide-diphospho-sugar transferase domain-containing protein n=1 Tax=Adiantum capillus-veneris TaxID=13818 RepID=A0A9D4U9I6_ADICA|nr:hypothetical protein GOP47_0020628 [Adiantum capillus-veneris]